MRNSILLLVLLVALVSGDKNEPKKAQHFCGKEVDKVMTLLCQNVGPQPNALSKRSFHPQAGKRSEYETWKRIFNVNDNTTGKQSREPLSTTIL